MKPGSDTNPCGSCSMCCKLLPIEEPDLVKPRDIWCGHHSKGHGCAIYNDRPEACRGFECHWLQAVKEGMSPSETSLRPDKCKVLIRSSRHEDGRPALQLIVDPGYPAAHESSVLMKFIRLAHSNGTVVIVCAPNKTITYDPLRT